MAGGRYHYTIESLKGLRELARITGGNLDAMASACGLPKAEINRALDAMLGRTTEEELAHAVTWLSGGREPQQGGGSTDQARRRPKARKTPAPQAGRLQRFLSGVFR